MSDQSRTHAGPYTRIGVIGDIHTRADRLPWAIDVLRQHQVQRVCATGDVVDGPLPGSAIARCCQLLRSADAVTVLGNHDRWLLDGEQRDLPNSTQPEEIDDATRDFLQQLPASAELQTPHGLLLLGHGLGNNDMGSLYPYDHGPSLRDNAGLQALLAQKRHRFVVNGHTHVRMVRKLEETTFINAGALHSRREPCCVVVLDFISLRASFFDLDTDGNTLQGPEFDL